ncbi:MAG: XrtA system polysaccharide chain length determinant [Pseudomonadota bacterium]
MNELVAQVYEWGRVAWRRKWLALATAWAVALAIWAIVMVIPDRYEASARVFVEAKTALRPVLEGIAIDEDYQSQLTKVREALVSRPQLETVVRKTNLDAGIESPGQIDGLITALQSQIKIDSIATDQSRGPASDMIYTISYQNTNRDMSVAVVRTLLSNLQEGAMSGSRSGNDQAQVFLDQQIGDLEKRLQESEERLADFKKHNVGMIPGEAGDYFTRMDKQMTGLQDAETRLAVAFSRQAELQRQLQSSRAYLPGTAALSNSVAMAAATPDISVRRQDAEQKLAELQLRYTEKHPEVIALQRTIAELKAKETAELAELQSGGMGTGAIRSLAANPVYQQIQSQLNQSRVEIASLQGEVTQHRNEIANLRRFVDQAPEIEQEFSRLNRDYSVTKAQYGQLVARREQAKVSDDASRTGLERFKILEPPRAPSTPVAPKRPLLIVAGLFAAIGAGLALALLPHLLAPTVGDTQTLERLFGIPVIGSVSEVKSEQQSRQEHKNARWAVFAGIGLFALAGILIAVAPLGAQLMRNLHI